MAVRRILAIQLKRLGDLVLATPALAALRDSGARVTLVTEPPFDQALEAGPDLADVRLHPRGWAASLRFGEELRKEKFDVAVDFQGSATSARLAWQSGAMTRVGWRLRGRRLAYTVAVDRMEDGPPRHTADRKLDLVRALGIPVTNAVPRLVLTGSERTTGRARLIVAARLTGQAVQDPGVLVAIPASRREYKRWPPEKMSALLDGFAAATGAPVVLVGGPGEEDQLRLVSEGMTRRPAILAAESIRSLLSILGAARAVVGPDGGARQLAEALDVPTLALFGPQDPVHWTRLEGRHRAIRGRRPDCRIRCSKSTTPCACLAALPVERVLSELLDLWQTVS